MTREDYKRCRNLMIKCVLGTDMSKHMVELGKFKAKIQNPEFNPSRVEDKEDTIVMMFHLADISNSTKPWDICVNWTERLFIEFFH